MRISRITVENFGCYAGETSLVLEGKPYAIVARHERDPERSNWLGKTTLLEAVRFALYGEHRHRTEDGWVTRGEKWGHVVVDFDDGSGVKRSRVLGKSTQLHVWRDPGELPMKQDEAQQELLRRLGLSSEDFAATCYFEQRGMARFILAKPDERMAVVSSWLRLEPLERAELSVRSKASAASLAASDLATRLSSSLEQEKRELADFGVQAPEELAGKLVEAQGRFAAAETAVAAVLARVAANDALRASAAKVEEYEVLCREGSAAKAAADAVPAAPAEQEHAAAAAREREAAASFRAASADEGAKRRLAQGQFDGRCPVAEIACPAAQQINAARARNASLYATAQERSAAERGAHEEAFREERRLDAALQASRRTGERLAVLRERERAMRPEAREARRAPPPADSGELARELEAATERQRQEAARCLALEASVRRLARLAAERETLSGKLVAAEAELGTLREASTLLGKGGAQRRVAEDALSAIEEGANDMLRSCGIDLTALVQWAREGKGLAKTCDACGHPFPDSARAKECSRCGAPRGPLLVNKLTIELSNRSGAAEDLAGTALQLSASAWLREDRCAAWSVALIDEPCGMLDQANRRAFTGGLTRMLGLGGFDQALVIAHHASVLDSLPGRIEVTSDGARASARVTA